MIRVDLRLMQFLAFPVLDRGHQVHVAGAASEGALTVVPVAPALSSDDSAAENSGYESDEDKLLCLRRRGLDLVSGR